MKLMYSMYWVSEGSPQLVGLMQFIFNLISGHSTHLSNVGSEVDHFRFHKLPPFV